eukprot:13834588-Ditylum_brightwellii.AAC.1
MDVHQTVFKHIISQSNQAFTGRETVVSGYVASDCSRKECDENCANMSMMLKRKLYQIESPNARTQLGLAGAFVPILGAKHTVA